MGLWGKTSPCFRVLVAQKLPVNFHGGLSWSGICLPHSVCVQIFADIWRGSYVGTSIKRKLEQGRARFSLDGGRSILTDGGEGMSSNSPESTLQS